MRLDSGRLVWERDGRDWPHREQSRFVEAGGLRWHVQRFGAAAAPIALLIHGTGASTHSWAGLAPLLAARYEVLAMDLPGHAFTRGARPEQLSLPGIAGALTGLLDHLAIAPVDVALVAGHSAGAAIGVRLVLDGRIAPARLASLNGALMPLSGLAGRVFSPVARMLSASAWVPRLFAWRAADPLVLKRLLDGTGSALDARATELYGRLVACPAHAAGALGMMARWDLAPIERALPRLAVPLDLVVGAGDRTVPPVEARRVRERAPSATLTVLPGLGHLAHEEAPRQVAEALWRHIDGS